MIITPSAFNASVVNLGSSNAGQSVSKAKMEENLDFSLTANNTDLPEMSQLEDGNALGGLIDVLKGLISTLQSLLGLKSSNDSINTDRGINKGELTHKTGVREPKSGDIVDVTISGVGLLEDAEYMDNAAVNKYFSEIGFNPNQEFKGEKYIDMSNVANVYKKQTDNGVERLYFVDKDDNILYTAGFWKRKFDDPGRGFHIDKYIDNGDYYTTSSKSGGTRSGFEGLEQGLLMVAIAPKVIDKDGNLISLGWQRKTMVNTTV